VNQARHGWRVCGVSPHDARHFTAAERHANERAKRERTLTLIVKGVRQAGVGGCLHRDTDPIQRAAAHVSFG
jgi:hypothetical protein